MTRVKVAVLDDWQGVARSCADWSPLLARTEVVFFEQSFASQDDAATRLADFDIVLSMRERTPLPASLIHRLPKLRMLGITGSHNASLDTAACTARGIVVCNTTGGRDGRAAPAELALGLLVAAARAIPAADASMRAGQFQSNLPVGIGSHMARYCLALGMTVLAWSENLTAEAARVEGATLVSKQQLLSSSDAISIHLVLSRRSEGIIGRDEIAQMKQGAILINTSRGPIVDESALIEAVRSRRIVAALDVYDQEPLPQNHPLRTAPNTILTPHLGYAVRDTLVAFYGQSVENAVAFLDGRPLRVTNPEALGTAG
jgi:phosphoglycerate dehydrogenase-like enzyme